MGSSGPLQPFDALYVHDFVRAVFDDNVDVKNLESGEVDEFGFYLSKCAFALGHLLTWCKQLDQATEFLVNFDRAKKISATRADHLIYSVENYLIRLNSAYDRTLQLTNSVFHLCIDSQHVSHAVVISNLKVVHRPAVVRAQKAVRRYLEKYAQDRHTLVHRHSLLDEKLRRLELFYLYPPEVVRKDPEGASQFKNYRANYLREYVVARRKEFKAVNGELAALLSSLFSALQGAYKEQCIDFHNRGF